MGTCHFQQAGRKNQDHREYTGGQKACFQAVAGTFRYESDDAGADRSSKITSHCKQCEHCCSAKRNTGGRYTDCTRPHDSDREAAQNAAGKPQSGMLPQCRHQIADKTKCAGTDHEFEQIYFFAVFSVEETASCIYTQKGNKKIRKPQAANQTALIFDRRAAARLLSINSIRRLCWS